MPSSRLLAALLFVFGSALFLGRDTAGAFQNPKLGIIRIGPKECCLGWREWVQLPEFFPEKLIAKIDSGARTSALHAENIELFEKDGEEWVRFVVGPGLDKKHDEHLVESRVVEIRSVRDASGVVSTRPVIKTEVVLGNVSWDIQVSLTDRSQFGHRLLLGRNAWQDRFLVDATQSFVKSDVGARTSPEQARERRLRWYEQILRPLGIRERKTSLSVLRTVAALLTLFLLHWSVVRLVILRRVENPDSQREFRGYVRNITLALAFIAIVSIWSDQFRTVSLYMMAVSVALVILMKEVTQNVHGGIFLAGSRAFRIGERIEIRNIRGVVVDSNLFFTKITETGARSHDLKPLGKVTVIPNRLFLANPMVNESRREHFELLSFVYPIKDENEWQEVQGLFRGITQDVAADFAPALQRAMQQRILSTGDATYRSKAEKPEFRLKLGPGGRLDLLVQLQVPEGRAEEIESEILTRFFTARYKKSAEEAELRG